MRTSLRRHKRQRRSEDKPSPSTGQSSETRHGEREQAWRQYQWLQVQRLEIEIGKLGSDKLAGRSSGFPFLSGVRIGSGYSRNPNYISMEQGYIGLLGRVCVCANPYVGAMA
jgi:hypothetical protein